MKIFVIFTGGTIGSSKIGEVISPDRSCGYALLDMYNRIYGGVDFTTAEPYTILSENLCGENLNQLSDCINKCDIDSFDGIIVTHGTDTLQFTSAFLGLVFADFPKPIVVVSANYPLEDKRSNGFVNFLAAVEFIRSGCGSGAFVAYTNSGEAPKIHYAAKLLAHPAYSDEVRSIHDEIYAVHNLSAQLNDNNAPAPDCVQSFAYNLESGNSTVYDLRKQLNLPQNKKLSSRSGILWLKSYVSMTYPKITSDIKAVLLEGYHSGTLNTLNEELKDFCRQAEIRGVPVYLTGAEKGFYYESKLMFDELKIRVLPPVPPATAYVWLWLNLSNA